MAKKKPVPNPLPCGCGAKGTQDWDNAVDTGYSLRVGYKNIHVVHCPVHAAAPDLLAACRRGLADLVQFIELAGTGDPETYEAVAQLRAAIAKAK
jgi:hypothetical protein